MSGSENNGINLDITEGDTLKSPQTSDANKPVKRLIFKVDPSLEESTTRLSEETSDKTFFLSQLSKILLAFYNSTEARPPP